MTGSLVDFRLQLTRANLAQSLTTSELQLTTILTAAPAELFEQHSLPKRNRARGRRIVWEIRNDDVARTYKALLERLDAFARAHVEGYPGQIAHGYIRGRSIVSNAGAHIHAPRLLNADIAGFFPSITTARVKEALEHLGIPLAVAQDIADLVTVDGSLSLGLPPSPLIANLVCLELDRKLLALATALGATVTRYADDITFSGHSLPSREQLRELLRSEGFELADDKFRVRKRGQATFVTGLSVSDDNHPRVPKRFKHRLRQELHFAEQHGIVNHIERNDGNASVRSGINRIDGSIRFIRGVEPALGKSMHSKWIALLKRDKLSVNYLTRVTRSKEPLTLFVDESEMQGPLGQKMLALICVVVENVDTARTTLDRLLADFLADPFNAMDKVELKKKGLHFQKLSPDLQLRAYDAITRIPCRAYVAFDVIEPTYRDTYERLLQVLLRRRFTALDGRPVSVICEQNPRVPANVSKRAVSALYGELASKGAKRPAQEPSTTIQGKADSGLALADGLLWAFRRYATETALPAMLRFERLGPVYRVVHDLPTGTVYDRRKPFRQGTCAPVVLEG